MSGGIKGNLPVMPGQGHLPKRLRPRPSPEEMPLVARALTRLPGISSTLGKRRVAELRYAVAHKRGGGQKLRGRYRP